MKPRLMLAGAMSVAAFAGLAGLSGCTEDRPPNVAPVVMLDRTLPPPRGEEMKPLPPPARAEPPPMPYEDPPLVYQPVPEQKAFLEAYNKVARPRIVVFVNRSLTGDLMGNEPAPVGGPSDPYLKTGQYDEALAKQIDYAAIENTLSQWLACDGQSVLVSPSAVRQRLTEAEAARLQTNQPRLISELVQQLNAEVIVFAQARPTRQTEKGLEIRLIAEAINAAHGERIGGATILIPPPLDTDKIDRFTRYMSRRLMSDMTLAWSGPGPNPPGANPTGANSPGAVPPTGLPQPAPAPLVVPPASAPPASPQGNRDLPPAPAPQPVPSAPLTPPVTEPGPAAPPATVPPSLPSPPSPSTMPTGGQLQTVNTPPPEALPEPTPVVPTQVPGGPSPAPTTTGGRQ